MRPTIPAAASACPTEALVPDRATEAPGLISCDSSVAPTSIGSPSAVPVPWASMLASRLTAARCMTERYKSRCALPLGAVKLALLPSCLAQLPSMEIARTPSSSICLATERASETHASLRAYPSARTSNVWHRPSTEVIPATAKHKLAAGESMTLTAATMAPAHSTRS